jgi:hypothetical protein
METRSAHFKVEQSNPPKPVNFCSATMKVVRELGKSRHSLVEEMRDSMVTFVRKRVSADSDDPMHAIALVDQLKVCVSSYLIEVFTATLNGKDLTIMMEYMDCSSLDAILNKINHISINMTGRFAISVSLFSTKLFR